MKKVFRNRVININGMYFKYGENGEFELTSDLLNAYFFYEKEYCERIANTLIEKFPRVTIEIQKLFMDIEIQEVTTIQ